MIQRLKAELETKELFRIGRKAENEVEQFDFDFTTWQEKYGEGSAVLLVQRNRDDSAYPVPLIIENGIASWVITDTDTAKSGRGTFQLEYVSGTKKKKSDVWHFICGISLEGTLPAPDPYEDWLDTLTDLGTLTTTNAQTATAAATSAQASAESASQSAQAAGVAQTAAEAAQSAAETAQGKAETAQAAAESAKTNAQLQAYNARESARDAELAKQTAVNSASTASTKATAAAQSATASANSASESAESAMASDNSASEASQSATSASESAQSASASATTAQSASASASQSASNASASAIQASASATSASTSASNAQTSATNASTSATQASESATQASTSATNASTSATQAQEYAEQAEESAEHFVLDTKLIKDSTNGVENQAIYPLLGAFPVDTATGSVASFSDGAELPLKSLTVNIDPVQNLNGYDSPWPAGGGKNLLNADAVSSENKYIHCENGNTFTPSTDIEWRYSDYIEVTSGEVLFFGEINAPANGAGTAFYTEQKEYLSGFSATQLSNAGNVWTVPENAKYMRHSWRIDTSYNVDWQNTVYITLNSNPHTFSPYSNICPISGWEGMNLRKCGKNLLHIGSKEQTLYGVTFVQNEDGTITANGTATRAVNYNIVPESGYAKLSDIFGIKAGVPYVMSSGVNGSDSTYWMQLLINGSGKEPKVYSGFSSPFSFTADKIETTRYRLCIRVANGQTLNNVVFRPMICLATETDTTFEPYHGTPITIDFGQTVYGGVLDVLSGKVTVDMAMVDLGNLNWRRMSNPNGGLADTYLFAASISPLPKKAYSGITSAYKWAANYIYFTQNCSAGYIYNANIAIRDDRYTDAVEFTNAVKGQKLVYEIAEPTEVQLDPHEVNSLLGVNNIYADTGDTSVEYMADPTLYIQRKIAEAISALS